MVRPNMAAISGTARLSKAQDIVAAELDGELLLMNIDQGKYVGLTATARHFWELVNPDSSLSELCSQLREQYRAPPGKIESDVMVLVDQLVEHHLLIIS